MNKGSWGKVRAFFDIMTDEGFTIKGFKLIEGINGLFVGVPSQKGKDDEYFDTVFIAPELREELNHLAMQTYGMEAPTEFPNNQQENNPSPLTNKETSPTLAETPTDTPAETVEAQNTDDGPEYSDDDIPF